MSGLGGGGGFIDYLVTGYTGTAARYNTPGPQTGPIVYGAPLAPPAQAPTHLASLDPAIAALTLNQILSHTSGLKDTAVMNGRHDDSALGAVTAIRAAGLSIDTVGADHAWID